MGRRGGEETGTQVGAIFLRRGERLERAPQIDVRIGGPSRASTTAREAKVLDRGLVSPESIEAGPASEPRFLSICVTREAIEELAERRRGITPVLLAVEPAGRVELKRGLAFGGGIRRKRRRQHDWQRHERNRQDKTHHCRGPEAAP